MLVDSGKNFQARFIATIVLAVFLFSYMAADGRSQFRTQSNGQNPGGANPAGLNTGGFGSNLGNGPQPPNLLGSQPQGMQGQGQRLGNAGYQDPSQQVPRVASLQNPIGGNGTPNNNAASAAPTSESTSKISTRNLLQIFHDGGWMMYPIALCSFVWTVFALERFVFLRAGRIIPRPFVRRLIEQLQQQQIEREEALELCERNSSPFALILTAAVKKYGKPAVEIEQSILDAGERVTFLLRRHLRLLNSISNVAPLLGLLGTVLGMIESFNGLAAADSSTRSQLLAGGIGHAMLTTAAGLMVAIPAYLSYMYYLGRTDRLLMEMDEYAQQVVEAISSEGLAESEYGKSRGRSRRSAA